MRAKAHQFISFAKVATPYMWGFTAAAAAALDRVVDIQTLFLPILAVALAVSAGSLAFGKARR